jgi:hypothetical protein
MANLKVTRARRRTKAQAFVEFAIIVPLLLIVLTGIIEFGYAFYTWAAVGEVARIATRYAVTGDYDTQYCPAADTALGLGSADAYGGDPVDCKVPSSVDGFEDKTAALQDWARLPSIRDAGMNAGSVGLLFDPGVSGDYVAFLSHPHVQDTTATRGFSSDYRGSPTANGFISINVCSNRAKIGGQVKFESSDFPHYYTGMDGNNDARYLGVCLVPDDAVPATFSFKDDAGGAGDRIRVTVTYNHPMIIPFFSALWQHLKISTTQDAIVERFRTSRQAGLSGGISVASTYTDTPLPPTETNTLPPPTATFTPTPPPPPCPTITPGTGLRVNYYAYFGNSGTNPFDNLVYSGLDPLINHPWGGGRPNPSVPADNFRGVWDGQIYPPYPGDYEFVTRSDDGVRLYVDGERIINNWTDHGDTYNYHTKTLTCQKVDIRLEYYENGGDAIIALGWNNGNFSNQMPIQTQYLYPYNPIPLPTSTYVTPTPTVTFTASATRTRTNTLPPQPPTNTYTASPVPPPATATVVKPNTDTPVPTNTFTPTKTKTPVPTCPFSKDAGGCTPVP